VSIDSSLIDGSRRKLVNALGILALGSLATMAPAQSEDRVIDIVARRFEFVPDELHVHRGETVILRFTAPDVPMGFHLADFGLRTDIMPGMTTTLRLTPDKVGSFIFLCDIFCGTGHEEMNGTLIVS
jgi:cytochrome c oxidase subunit 2